MSILFFFKHCPNENRGNKINMNDVYFLFKFRVRFELDNNKKPTTTKENIHWEEKNFTLNQIDTNIYKKY